MANAFLLKPLVAATIAMGAAPSFDFTTGVMPAGATLTRASAGTYYNEAGLLTLAAANVARFQHNPGALGANQVPNSTAIDLWPSDGSTSTVTANAVVAPDGTMTADLVALPAVAAGGRSTRYQSLPAAGGNAVYSAWFKGAAGGEVVWIMAYDSRTGVFTSTRCALTTSWQRFQVEYNDAVGTGQRIIFIGVDTRDPTQAATPAQSFSVWDAECQATAPAIGLLIESARTNRIINSDLSDWQVSGGASKAAASVPLPNGSIGGVRMTEGTAGIFNAINAPGDVALANGNSLSVSIYVKPETGTFLQILTGNGTGFVNFDFANMLTFSGGGAAGGIIEKVANGFYRITALGLIVAGGTQPIYLAPVTALNAARGAPAATTGRTWVVWGPQVELAATQSTLINSAGAAGTRSADVLTLNWTAQGVADGSYGVQYFFDDLSSQVVLTTVAGGVSTVPTTLNRPTLRSASLVGAATSPDIGAATNLLNDYAGVIAQASCKSAPLNAALILIDLGADTVIDTAMVFGVELFPTTGTLTVNYATAAQGAFTGAYSTDVTGVPYAGSAPMTSGKGVSLWSLAAPVTARYLQLVYSAGAGVTGKSIRASRVVVGKRIQLSRNFSYGATFGVRDLGSLDFSARGVLLRRRAAKLRTVALTFSNIRKDEVDAVTKPLLEQIGNTEMVALVTDPTPDAQIQNRCYFGPLVGDLSQAWRNAAAFETKVNLVSIF